ncbi:hypothetical protein SpCBS45565_g02290 [Spizellomyces sp. 'palustris']|nr:hypothetical protein SpCBS45565_g02290 [Spizellomyces sp. 'palustris']
MVRSGMVTRTTITTVQNSLTMVPKKWGKAAEDIGQRIGGFLAVNIGLTVSKGVGGVLWHSASLLAEAVHSLSDFMSDFVTLYAYRKARAKPDAKFPFGYAKLEPLGGVIVSGLLIAAGAGIAVHSCELLLTLLHDSTSNHHGAPENGAMNPLALYIMLASVVSKEAMFQWTMRVGRKVKSDVLIANAWHHRADAASSLVALVGVAGAVYGIKWFDPVGGLLVSGMVIKAGLESGIPALKELIDAAAPPETVDRVTEVVQRLHPRDHNIRGIGPIRVRKSGPFLNVDMQVLVNPHISISHAHQISENLKHDMVKEIQGLQEVSIHLDSEMHDLTEPSPSIAPTSVIEADVVREGMKGMEEHVQRISHIALHFLKGGITVHADILPRRDDMTISEAREIALQVQKRIEGIEGVKCADVHLEINSNH